MITENDFNEIAEAYSRTHNKPDKRYVILETMLFILNPLQDRIVLDIGCGDGFFTEAINAQTTCGKPRKIIGIDNNSEQIRRARFRKSTVVYMLQDLYSNLPACDRINAPFVFNYARTVGELEQQFQNYFKALHKQGILAGAIDLPKVKTPMQEKNARKFGATKKLLGPAQDSTPMTIKLFNGTRACDEICSLHATYYTPKTIERCAINAGFRNIEWVQPRISNEGITVYGSKFWKNYDECCELGFLKAIKV